MCLHYNVYRYATVNTKKSNIKKKWWGPLYQEEHKHRWFQIGVDTSKELKEGMLAQNPKHRIAFSVHSESKKKFFFWQKKGK